MKIGIDARFFRKPGTGIGQVTREFLHALMLMPEAIEQNIIVYVEEVLPSDLPLPSAWRIRVLQSWYRRDDTVREYLWGRFTLPRAVLMDECQSFLSLAQSVTVLPQSVRHLMLVHDLVPLHFPDYLELPHRKFFYRQLLRAIKTATLLVTPSMATQTDLISSLSLVPQKIWVVPLGLSKIYQVRVRETTLETVLKRYGLQRGYIYHGGGVEKRKNTARLLEAYARLSREKPDIPVLVVSGKLFAASNKQATDVVSLVKQYQLEKKVHLLGFVPEADLPSLYAGALFFVYPSLFEGFGLPVLEAFGCGTPVLTSNVSALPEIADDAALFCNPRESTDLIEKMRLLLENENLRQTLARRGQERSRKYSWEQFTKKIFELLIRS